MPYFCAVKGCGNKACRTKNNPELVFHRFPRNQERLKKWIRFCGWTKDWQPQKSQGICSVHFDDSCYDERFKIRSEVIGAKLRRQLRADAVPGVISDAVTFDEATFNYTFSGGTSQRMRPRANNLKEDNLTVEAATMMTDEPSDEKYGYEHDEVQDEVVQTVEGKLCKICLSMLYPQGKYLLQHATMGKSYKDIIQETLNVTVFYDDDYENMRVCGNCSTFIEDLNSFVKLCRENLSRIVDKSPHQKQHELQLSHEEDCYDNNSVSLREEIPDSNPVDTKSVIHENSFVHESQHDETTHSRMVDPLDFDAGPSISYDDSVKKDAKLLEKSASDTPVKCNVCGKNYTNDRQLHVHMNLHSKKIEYPCQYCEKVFYVWRSQQDHEQTHLDTINNVEYRCTECNSVHSNKKQLDVHFKLNHLGIRKYACLYCDFCSNQKDRLLNHVRGTHKDKRPYGCTTCGSNISNAVNHYIHFQIHRKKGEAKEYNIKCAYCGVLFTKDAVFERHLIDDHLSENVVG